MKLSEYRDAYHDYSGRASEIARQLAFAGIAIVWVFKTGSSEIPEKLLLPTMLLVLFLIVDLSQYFAGSVVWRMFFRHYEKKAEVTLDAELKAPTFFSGAIWIL